MAHGLTRRTQICTSKIGGRDLRRHIARPVLLPGGRRHSSPSPKELSTCILALLLLLGPGSLGFISKSFLILFMHGFINTKDMCFLTGQPHSSFTVISPPPPWSFPKSKVEGTLLELIHLLPNHIPQRWHQCNDASCIQRWVERWSEGLSEISRTFLFTSV